MIGAFLTALYTFRLVFIVFFGELRTRPSGTHGLRMGVPLMVLAVLSIGGGWLDVPSLLEPLFGTQVAAPPAGSSMARVPEMLVTGLALLGVCLAYVLYLWRPDLRIRWLALPGIARLQRLSFSGLGFDRMYDRVLVRPFLWLVRVNRDDIFDAAYNLVASGIRLAHHGLSGTQTGVLRWYAAGMVFGTVLLLGVAVWG